MSSIYTPVVHPRIERRKKERPVKVHDMMPRGSNPITRFNTWLAIKVTNAVGTMWCAYAFAALALVSLPAALAVSAAYAFLTGLVCLRTKGVYFIMITLAFGQMAFFTASSLAPFGGDDGLTIAARNTVAGFALLRNEGAFYYVVLFARGGLLGLTSALARRIMRA